MNFTIAKEQIIAGLQAVQNLVPTRTTLPILSNVLLRAEDDRLFLTATDLDITVTCSVQAKVATPGSTTLPVKKLFGIVRELGFSDIDFEISDKHVCQLQSGASFYKLNGLAPEEFPPTTPFNEDKKVTLAQEKLRVMLKRTAFAASSDESRYVLNGIFISFKEHKMTLVATDGRRLALTEEEMEVPPSSYGDFIVPSKAVNELNRLLQDKGEIELRFSANQASFFTRDDKGGSVLLVTKLIDGNYPNYRQVIPAEAKERVALPREEFMQALRRAGIMTTDKVNSVKFSLTRNNLAITANSPEVGEARESMALNYKGKDISIAFNPAYMIEPLMALTDDEVYLELVDDTSPGVLKINGPYLYVVMPMRI